LGKGKKILYQKILFTMLKSADFTKSKVELDL